MPLVGELIAAGVGTLPVRRAALKELLAHGDALCTDDAEYQAFRMQSRSPEWQSAFLQKPLAERHAIARALRERSEAGKLEKAGRADYQVRATFVFELADREVISAMIQGTIAQELRDCLLSAVDSLAVPRFTGRVVVRYPLATEREPLPSQIELAPETAGEIDRLTAP